MELMLLVWLVDLLVTFDNFVSGFFSLGVLLSLILITLIVVVCYGLMLNPDTDEIRNYAKKVPTSLVKYFPKKIIISLVVVAWLIPSQQTMKYMAGAYLLQATFTSEFVQESMTLSQKAILQTLKSWSEDSPELKDVLTNTMGSDIVGEVIDKVVVAKDTKPTTEAK